ncbi:putative curved dna-binding protein [Botrytis fragariae]|uniref:Putative curved dna-binding protein n=1 Tax=Botrytis fragariae TaxID=1964551 RepID=A0A8H6API3_9HELO|nr:putative curved dna-binding protein [Botrytis fragariae]KAF5871254.1 putative curved dna-binding protein [Botrytis fragariae]
MAPVQITEDYYAVLEIEQTATQDLIIRSYRRLALKLHPDRNDKADATEAFQLLAKAYETLKDESKRRIYDIKYPSIKKSGTMPQSSSTPQYKPEPQASASASSKLTDAAQIAALQKAKQERAARWSTKKNAFESVISRLQKDIQSLKQSIELLKKNDAVEDMEEAWRNGWGAWLLSPLVKRAVVSEDEKERKDRSRQERKIEMDLKERRIGVKSVELDKEKDLLQTAQREVELADQVDDGKLRMIEDRIKAKERRQADERARVYRERMAEARKKEQEERDREAAEELRKREEEWKIYHEEMMKCKAERQAALEKSRKEEAEQRAAAQKLREERDRQWKIDIDDRNKWNNHYNHYNLSDHDDDFFAARETLHKPLDCRHGGWWPKIEGRDDCPQCYESWTPIYDREGDGICEQEREAPVQSRLGAGERAETQSDIQIMTLINADF